MTHPKLTAMVMGLCTLSPAFASSQTESNGFVEDSHLDVLLRNAFIQRDKKHNVEDQSEWGQGATATFRSGFTQGTVGVGVDAFGTYGLRLDGGRGRSGGGGIDFFNKVTLVLRLMTLHGLGQQLNFVSPTLF